MALPFLLNTVDVQDHALTAVQRHWPLRGSSLRLSITSPEDMLQWPGRASFSRDHKRGKDRLLLCWLHPLALTWDQRGFNRSEEPRRPGQVLDVVETAHVPGDVRNEEFIPLSS